MAIEITVPRLGWTMEEGVFIEWLKQDGDPVEVGDALYSIEGEKAIQEVEAIDAGILRIAPDGPREGDAVLVGALLGFLVGPDEKAPFGAPKASAPVTAKTTAVSDSTLLSAGPAAGPAVRRLAREMDVDLRKIQGTGSAGRITDEDVRGAAAPKSGQPAISPRAARLAAELGVDFSQLKGTGRTGRIRVQDVRHAAQSSRTAPAGPVRRTIAQRMATSAHTTAPVTLTTTADATHLVSLRGQFKATTSDNDIVPGYTDLIVKLTAVALGDHPFLNARWDGDDIIVSERIHIGIAVDTEAGLLVPVIRDVPTLTLRQLAARSRELIERAQSRRLSPEEMQGGTFTITNLGAFGVEAFTPIINLPECAILGLGRIQRQPAVVDEKIVVRELMALSLTFDHRVTDGGPAARFLQTIRDHIERPGPWLMA